MAGGLLTGLAAPASAVTHGDRVSRPSVRIPWVVTVYAAEKSADVPQLICSGSALSAREVLTAAQCVKGKSFYFIKVGADTLPGGRLIPVEAIRSHPAANTKNFVADVAVLRPMYNLDLKVYAKLASPAMAAAVRSRRPPALTMFGWGNDHTGKLTGNLNSAAVALQTSVAVRHFRAAFRPTVMLAAGRLRAPKKYSGACSGDSGGPLTITVRRVPYIVGVTSFGAKSFGAATCAAAVPTVFTSVGNYAPWFPAARRALPGLATTDNRAVPVQLTPPVMTGTVSLGSVLTCSAGTWTPNATSFAYAWLRTDTAYPTPLGTGATHTIVAGDSGTEMTCVVTASSRAGGTDARASVKAIAAPSSYASATVTGLLSYGSPAEARNAVATCSPPAYAQPEIVSTFAWFMEKNSVRTALATTQTVTMTDPILISLADGKLVCVVVSSNAMGTVTNEAHATISSLKPPHIYATVSTPSATPLVAGVTAACTVTGAEDATVTYRWAIEATYVSTKTLTATAVVVGTGPSYTVTAADMTALRGHYLACEATAVSWQGSDSTVDNKSVYLYG